MPDLDLTPYRLEAARNTGIVIEFRRAQGRDFTGSRADYALLNQEQQLRLSGEMSRLLERDRNPAVATVAKLAGQGTAVLTTGPALAITSSAPLTLTGADVGRAVVQSAAELPQTLGRAVEAATGGTVSSLLTKVALIGGLLVGGYLLITYAPRPRGR